jgi:hypothetical protein
MAVVQSVTIVNGWVTCVLSILQLHSQVNDQKDKQDAAQRFLFIAQLPLTLQHGRTLLLRLLVLTLSPPFQPMGCQRSQVLSMAGWAHGSSSTSMVV